MAIRFNRKKILQDMHQLMDIFKDIPRPCLTEEVIHQNLKERGFVKKCGNLLIHPEKCVAIETYTIENYNSEVLPPPFEHLFGMNYTVQFLFSPSTFICNLRDADAHVAIIHSDNELKPDEANALLFPSDGT